MNNRKRFICCLLVSAFSLTLSGCGKKQENKEEESTVVDTGLPQEKQELRVVEGVNFDYSKTFFDDFTNGVDYNTWIISEDCWGSNRGGLTVKNLFYTDEGTLLLRANGNHYSGDEVQGYGSVKDGRDTGASLVSKFVTGPGRYEVKMKPMPRLGGCTAFWTYSNRPVSGSENDNHEIDIELPGGKSGGVHSFQYMMNTNYVTETYMANVDFKLSEATNNKVINLNDGNFHTFGFDWYTNPELIVYHVDNVVTAVSNVFIPYLLTRIWVGVWISITDNFMGAPEFESDFMEIDWVKYIPFDSTQPYTVCEVDEVSKSCPKELYPTSPVSRPIVNKISNGDFEYFIRKGTQDKYGWTFKKFNSESREVPEVCYLTASSGKDNTAGAVVKGGGYLTTTVDSSYAGYKYDLSFDAFSDGEDSVCEVVYYSSYVPDTNPLSSEIIHLTKDQWKHYSQTITCPDRCSSMTVEFYNTKFGKSTSSMQIDNVAMSRS